MGLVASSLLLCRRTPQLRILMFGLDAAGKTSLLYQMKTGELITTIPTIGFNVESVVMEGRASLTLWDFGGRDKIRPLFRHYFSSSNGLIFVIDSNDQQRLPEAMEELNRIAESLTSEGMPDLPIAVLCNKCDMRTEAVTQTHAEVQKLLSDEASLQTLPGVRGRPLGCFAVSAATGEGLTDALSWLIAAALHQQAPAVTAKPHLQEGTEKVAPLSGSEVQVAAKAGTGWIDVYHFVKSVMQR